MSAPLTRHLAIVGPTASGKSALALALASERPDVEILSADAMAVYRGMDVGTAKPSPADRAAVPHHLVDIADPAEDYSVARFQLDCGAALADIEARSHTAVLVGGTGLYVTAALDGLTVPGRWPDVVAELEQEADTRTLHARLAVVDPLAASRMEPTNRRRIVRALEVTLGSGRPFSSHGPGVGAHPPIRFALVGLRVPNETLAARIEARFDRMLAAGFVDEVATLAARPAGWSRTARQAVGYRELLDHLEGRLSLDEARSAAIVATRRLARRQRAWHRRDSRVRWIEPDEQMVGARAEVGPDLDRCRISS